MSGTRKVAVVTGAAQGFGRAISVGLARTSVDVVAVDLTDPKETTAAAAREGVRGVSLIADVSDPASGDALTQLLDDEFGRCDVLVNNTGIYPNKSIDEVDFALWRRVHAINLDTQFLMVKAVLPLMKRGNWGRIVNITTNSLGLVGPGLSHYMASKADVVGFIRGLANDIAEYGVTVNAVGPTDSTTPGGVSNIGPELIEELAQSQAIKRAGTAEDIVGTVLFLVGEDSAWVTGQTIMADGGLVRV